MSTHKVTIQVTAIMDEMDDPNPETSAEIASDIIAELVQNGWDADAEIVVIDAENVEG